MSKRSARGIIVAENRDAVRIPRKLWRSVEFSLVQPPFTYAERIKEAVERRPDLLVIDRLTPQSAGAALEAAEGGVRMLAQIDTIFRGPDVGRALLKLGVGGQERLGGLRWVMAVQRLPTLCPHCKQLGSPVPGQFSELHGRYPDLFEAEDSTFFKPGACATCRFTGRHGDVAAFDIFHMDGDPSSIFERSSILPLEAYMLRLAASGHLPLSDVQRLESEQLRRTYNMLTASERALSDTNMSLERKLAELEAANKVLQQRTEALVSLQDVGQALISSTDLDDLATRVCRRACDICCADRALLYFFHSPDEAEILAVSGWDPILVGRRLDANLILQAGDGSEPMPFNQWPPGVPPRASEDLGKDIRAGLYLPLIAQDEQVGLMLVHTTQAARFNPGEVSLLQTFANQTALAIQRAGLTGQLRGKISELEAAQADLAQKERMERELELARQVQQSVLPRTFPKISGYHFAALNEPARQVGGDFYDVILLDKDRFGLVVGDVSDKGMPAALYMALTRSLLLAEARRELSPRAVLTNVNQLLLELGDPNMFVTVFYGVVDSKTRQLQFARAGHDYPLLMRGGMTTELRGQGTILGIFERDELHLSEENIALAPEDQLILYTDGLTDIISVDGRLFDRTQLKSLLHSYNGLSPAKLCAKTFADLAAYQGTAEQFDDMTMLVVAVE